MQASNILSVKTLLSALAVAMVLTSPFLFAPCAFAKKDLFATDPGAKQNYQAEQLVSPAASSSASSKESARDEALSETIKNEEKAKSAVAQAKSTTEAESEKKSSFLETQFSRLKDHFVETREDLFGSKKSGKKEKLTVPQQTEASVTDSTHSSEQAQLEVPTISTAEAAQRAQALTEGQVINVRKYQEDNEPRYAVKLLQKNGRMKTINLNAVSGALIEQKPLEETPQ